MDLGTLEGAKQYTESLFDGVYKNFADDGLIRPFVFVLASVDLKTGKPYSDGPQIVMVGEMGMMQNHETKNRFSEALRTLVEQTKAVGVVTIMESWTLPNCTAQQYAEYTKIVKAGGSIATIQGAIEVVFVTLEHCKATGPVMYEAKITRDADGKGTLQPFALYGSHGKVFDGTNKDIRSTGRFAGFLHNTH